MTQPMSDRQRQQRAAMIVGGAAIGGLAIIGLAIALTSGGGGDKTNAVDVSRTSTTSSSTTSSSSTSTSTTTTTTIVTLPVTAPATAPPTIITIPPTVPPTVAPTTKATTTTTKPPVTTSTTKPHTPAEVLAQQLDTALNGGQPDAPPRVTVKPLGKNKTLDVTWALDATLPPDEQGVQAREDALILMQTIQSENPASNDHMKLKATLPKDGGGTQRVILLNIDRSKFDAFDFSTFNPDDTDVFTLPFVTSSDINTDFVPDPYPPTTTTTEETTTTT